MIQTLNKILQHSTVNEALNLIKKSTKITFLTHMRPDADGISSCAALSSWCQKQNKQVETIYPSPLETTVFAEPENVKINTHAQTPDLIIICDTANQERLYFPKQFHEIPTINIDHHISNSIEGTYNFVASDVSSTCELVYFLLTLWDSQAIDTSIASMLLFGILYDSQSFQTNSTHGSTLKTAAALVEKGADLPSLNRLLTATKTIAIMKIWGKLLQNLEHSPSKQSIWITVTQEFCAQEKISLENIHDIHNFVMMNMPIDVVAFFKEVDTQTTKVSLRSSKTDVNQLAQTFGGGGHKHASGIMLNKPIQEVIKLITELLP